MPDPGATSAATAGATVRNFVIEAREDLQNAAEVLGLLDRPMPERG